MLVLVFEKELHACIDYYANETQCCRRHDGAAGSAQASLLSLSNVSV